MRKGGVVWFFVVVAAVVVGVVVGSYQGIRESLR